MGVQGARSGTLANPRSDIGSALSNIAPNVYSASTGARDAERFSDEREPIRLEITVDDPDLQAEFGIVTEQIDNVYLANPAIMMDVAIRKFFEYKIARQRWQVKTTFLPCVAINQVVQFTTPDGEDTITGLLSGLSLNYDGGGPTAELDLTIEGFSEVGGTVYMALGDDAEEIPSVGGGAAWIPGSSGSGNTLAVNSYSVLYTEGGGGSAELERTFETVVGDDYDFTFTLIKDAGSDIMVEIEDSGGTVTSSTYSASGTYTLSFTAGEVQTIARFSISGASVGWYMSQAKLIRTVTY